MIDTSILDKAEFIRIILDRDTRNIHHAQSMILASNINIDAKTLSITKKRKSNNRNYLNVQRELATPNYAIRSQGSQFLLRASMPVDLRFWDMRRKQDMRIYNRIVWGVLYNNAYPDIRFRYGEEIQDKAGNALRKPFNSSKK